MDFVLCFNVVDPYEYVAFSDYFLILSVYANCKD